MIENGDVAMDPIEGSDKGTIERRTAHGLSGRRAAIKKLALGAGGGRCCLGSTGHQRHLGRTGGGRRSTTLPPIIEGTPTSGLCADKARRLLFRTFGTTNSHNATIAGAAATGTSTSRDVVRATPSRWRWHFRSTRHR